MSQQDGEEIASRAIMCEMKRIWVDLKANPKGKFLKISEQDSAGNRQKIIVPLSGCGRFRDVLTSLAALDSSLGLPGEVAETSGPTPPIKTETLKTENKMFFFDLKQNARGRFLKINQVMGLRASIVIPARGIGQLRDAIEDVCRSDPQGSAGLDPVVTIPADQLPEAGQIISDQKRFFFDIGSNSRGVFMRVSEVVGTFRTSITIPRSVWPEFQDMFQKFSEKVDEIPAADSDN